MRCSIASTSSDEEARSSSAQQHCRPCPGSWTLLARACTAFLSAWIDRLSEEERAAGRFRVSIQMGEAAFKSLRCKVGGGRGCLSCFGVFPQRCAVRFSPPSTVARPERGELFRRRQLALICALIPGLCWLLCVRIPDESVAGLADARSRSG